MLDRWSRHTSNCQTLSSVLYTATLPTLSFECKLVSSRVATNLEWYNDIFQDICAKGHTLVAEGIGSSE